MPLVRAAQFEFGLSSGWVAIAICLAGSGCASSPTKPETAPGLSAATFQADATADAIPGSAEIVPELMKATPPRVPVKAGARVNPKTGAKTGAKAAKGGAIARGGSPGKPLKPGSPSARYKGPRGKAIHYIVKANDTLMKISFELLGDVYRWKEIYFENQSKIPDYNRLVKGTELVVHPTPGLVIERNGRPHLILPHETLWSISDSVYGTPWKWRRLWKNNLQLIHNPDLIYAYFSLYYQMTPKDEDEVQHLKLGRTTLPTPFSTVNSAPLRAPASGPGH